MANQNIIFLSGNLTIHRYPKRMRLVSNGLKRKNNGPFPKRFSLQGNPRKDGLMFPCLFCTNSKEQSLKSRYAVQTRLRALLEPAIN